MSNQGFKYNVDLVFCIDVTGSMSPVIDTVKRNALRFNGDLKDALAQAGKNIDSLRVRVIAFRDFGDNPATALELLDFVNLPDEETRFSSFVSGLRAEGGGDEPESGLETLAIALKSDWVQDGDRQRHIVVVWTDASAHPLGKHSHAYGGKLPSMPGGMPADLNALTDWWSGQSMSASAKRLILFTPDAEPWTSIATDWEQVVHVPSQAGQGLAECDYETILATIKNSI